MLAALEYNWTQWGPQPPIPTPASTTSGFPISGLQPTGLREDLWLSSIKFYGPQSYSQSLPPTIFVGNFSFSTSFSVILPESSTASGSYFVRVNYSASSTSATVRWYVQSSSAEVPNSTNLSTEVITIMAFGR